MQLVCVQQATLEGSQGVEGGAIGKRVREAAQRPVCVFVCVLSGWVGGQQTLLWSIDVWVQGRESVAPVVECHNNCWGVVCLEPHISTHTQLLLLLDTT